MAFEDEGLPLLSQPKVGVKTLCGSLSRYRAFTGQRGRSKQRPYSLSFRPSQRRGAFDELSRAKGRLRGRVVARESVVYSCHENPLRRVRDKRGVARSTP